MKEWHNLFQDLLDDNGQLSRVAMEKFFGTTFKAIDPIAPISLAELIDAIFLSRNGAATGLGPAGRGGGSPMSAWSSTEVDDDQADAPEHTPLLRCVISPGPSQTFPSGSDRAAGHYLVLLCITDRCDP